MCEIHNLVKMHAFDTHEWDEILIKLRKYYKKISELAIC